jgi:hypothetical protein
MSVNRGVPFASTGDGNQGEGETFTKTQLDEAVEAARREGQKLVTQAQQARAEDQRRSGREIGELRTQLEHIDKRLEKSGRGEADGPVDLPSDFDEVRDVPGLFKVTMRESVKAMGQLLEKRLGDLGIQERVEAIEDQALLEELANAGERWGLGEGQIRQVIEHMDDHDLADPNHACFDLFGAPGDGKPDRDTEPAPTRPQSTATGNHSVLSGRASTTPSSPAPQRVQVGHGAQGYADVEKIAGDWAKRSGIS